MIKTYLQLFEQDASLAFKIYDLCDAELLNACADCDIAYRNFKNSKGKSNKLRAESVYRYKQAVYCELLAAYYDFLGGDF